MLDRSQLPIAVGHADVVTQMGFHDSAGYLQTGESPGQAVVFAEVSAPQTLEERAFAVVEGNVLADIVLPLNNMLIVRGDVRASIRTTGICEVVIAGDIGEQGSVTGRGILHIFAGGDVLGSIGGMSSLKAWVQGHLRGKVWTGAPSNEVRVTGDCTGAIRPVDEAALLYLAVDGFMGFASLEFTGAFGYTVFNASIGRSDRCAGIYPDKSAYEALRQHRSHNRWVIRS
jgi:hypothetical protein